MSLRFVLLSLLSKEANTGYGIGRLLRTKLSHIWNARLQQIYPELARLETQGLVEAKVMDSPNPLLKRTYSLTPEGREKLKEWLVRPQVRPASRDDLLVKVYLLPFTPSDLIVRHLEERRDASKLAVHRLRRHLNHVEQRNDPLDMGYLLTLEAALMASEAQLSWCNTALARILGRG